MMIIKYKTKAEYPMQHCLKWNGRKTRIDPPLSKNWLLPWDCPLNS